MTRCEYFSQALAGFTHFEAKLNAAPRTQRQDSRPPRRLFARGQHAANVLESAMDRREREHAGFTERVFMSRPMD